MTDFSKMLQIDANRADAEFLNDTMKSIRDFMEMPTAFLAVFEDDGLVVRAVSTDDPTFSVRSGTWFPVDDGYHERVVNGLLPQIFTDTSIAQHDVMVPPGLETPVGSIISVPVRDPGARVMGLISCVSPAPHAISTYDFKVVSIFAKIAANVLNGGPNLQSNRSRLRQRIKNAIDGTRVDIHLQPIVNLNDGTVRGYEALSRFHDDDPYRSPQQWFEDAGLVGMQPLLECAVIVEAIGLLPFLPTDTYLSINASPDTVALGAIADILKDSDPERIVLELTEHQELRDLEVLTGALDDLRAMGMQVAIDDLGAGYASFSSVLKLKPDIIKMDISLVKSINRDKASQALTSAIVTFAADIGAVLIAEGIEHESERRTLTRLGVRLGQGFLLAKPNLPAEFGLSET